MVAKATGLP